MQFYFCWTSYLLGRGHTLSFHIYTLSFLLPLPLISGADLLRLTRDDLIQICGLADGIRLNNALQSK